MYYYFFFILKPYREEVNKKEENLLKRRKKIKSAGIRMLSPLTTSSGQVLPTKSRLNKSKWCLNRDKSITAFKYFLFLKKGRKMSKNLQIKKKINLKIYFFQNSRLKEKNSRFFLFYGNVTLYI